MNPHKDQDGYKYIRVKSFGKNNDGREIVGRPRSGRVILYDDVLEESSIISSERVERAVMTDDFLRRCASDGLSACFWNNRWSVADSVSNAGEGTTLLEAYGDYKRSQSVNDSYSEAWMADL